MAEEYDSCPGAGSTPSLSVILRVPRGLATPEALQAFLTRTTRTTAVRMQSKQQLVLKLSSIQVEQDGSAGETAWAFDLIVDGRRIATIPTRSYSDLPNTKRVTLSGANAVLAPIEVTPGRFWLLEISAKRSLGGDTASGAAAISDIGRPFEVRVASKIPRTGSFVFTFVVDKA